MVNNARLHRLLINEQEPRVAHQLHLIQSLINRHWFSLMQLLANNYRRIPKLFLSWLTDLQILSRAQRIAMCLLLQILFCLRLFINSA